MRSPKLPGAEKFRFSGRISSNDDTSSTEFVESTNESTTNIFNRSSLKRKSCPNLSSSNTFPKNVLEDAIDTNELISLNLYRNEYHNEYRKKVKLPITSRITSRVLRLANLSLEVFDIIDYYSYSKFKKFKSVKLESRTVKDIKNSSTSLESSIYSDQESSLSHHSSLDLSNPSPTYISSDITAL